MTLQKISPFIWLAGFLCSLFFVNDWQLELFASTVILIFVWAVVMLMREKDCNVSIPRSWVMYLMTLFLILVFFSISHSDVPNVSLMAFCFVSVMPISFLVFAVRGEKPDYMIIAKILALVFAGLSVWALLQFFVFGEHFGGRAHHPLKNPNSFGALLMMGFFCAVGWMLVAKERLHSNVALVLAILIFGGVMATGSRGAFFALLPALGLMLFVMRDQTKVHWRCLSILAAACVGWLLLSELGVAENDNLLRRVGDTVALNLADMTSNRTMLWQASANMIKDHMLLGTGIGTYFLYFPEYRLSEDAWGGYYAHSDPLQYWVELGILGPILFYTFVIAVTLRTIKAIKATHDIVTKALIIVPFCAVGAVVLHTHVTFNLYNLSILLSVGFLLAAWFWATQKVLETSVFENKFPDRIAPTYRPLIVALPFLFVAFFFMAQVSGEHFTNKARKHLAKGELELFAEDVIKAQQLSFYGTYRAPLLAVNVPLTLLQEASDELSPEQKKDVVVQALSYLQHVRTINPRSSSALYYLGKICQLAPEEMLPADLKTVEEYYLNALAIDPLHIGARVELAEMYMEDKDQDKALKILEGGYHYKYATMKAMDLYGRLAQLYVLQGDAKKGQAVLTKMRNFQIRMQKAREQQSASLSSFLWTD